MEGTAPPNKKVLVVFVHLTKILPGDSYKKIRLLPVLPLMTSPAITCLVTIPHKVLMSHKRNGLFKILITWCSLSTLELIGYSEIFLTLPQLSKLESILINSTPFIISLLHFKELNNLLLFLHHSLKNYSLLHLFL